MYNRLDELKEIIIANPRAVHEKEADGWTIAHWAAQRGYEDMMSFIADRLFLYVRGVRVCLCA